MHDTTLALALRLFSQSSDFSFVLYFRSKSFRFQNCCTSIFFHEFLCVWGTLVDRLWTWYYIVEDGDRRGEDFGMGEAGSVS